MKENKIRKNIMLKPAMLAKIQKEVDKGRAKNRTDLIEIALDQYFEKNKSVSMLSYLKRRK